MDPIRTPAPCRGATAPFLALGWMWLLIGCASPGAPHPPSLQLPEPVRDLQAMRSGDEVELSFTAPSRTSDDLPLKGDRVNVDLCRQVAAHDQCMPVDSAELSALTPGFPDSVEKGHPVLVRDHLPPALQGGPARAISYRISVHRPGGQSAGLSDPAYVAAGVAPPPVAELIAQGTRKGVLLQWVAVAGGGEVLLKRQQIAPAPTHAAERPSTGEKLASHKRGPDSVSTRQGAAGRPEQAGTAWLQADPGNTSAAHTLDGQAVEGFRYRYVAVRRTEVHLGPRTLELRSAPSPPVEVVWHDVYPPTMPLALTALGFHVPSTSGAAEGSYAVDLVWEPVNDTRLAGYLVVRTPVSPAGAPEGTPEQLTPTPLLSPAFHDARALPTQTYRYEVTAVDGKGNRSAPATALVAAQTP